MALTRASAAVVKTEELVGFRNKIINGAIDIDQRNAGASVTVTATEASQYFVDRFYIRASSATGSRISGQQSTVAPTGFVNSALLTSLSAYTLGASEHFGMTQPIEGLNIEDLAWGTSEAKTITISFWVRSSLTGTFGGHIANNATDRCFVYSYTINAANTWEYKTITIPGDTTGTWLTNNGVGLYLNFSVAAGSSVTTTAGSWGGTLRRSVTGQTSLVGTNGATFYLTGVQFEVGSVATPFERRPFGLELQLCQRYFETGYGLAVAPANGSNSYFFGGALGAWAYATNNMRTTVVPFSVTKRTAPSITLYNTGIGGISANQWAYFIAASSSWANYSDASNAVVTRTGFNVRSTSTSTSGVSYMIDGNWAADSEL